MLLLIMAQGKFSAFIIPLHIDVNSMTHSASFLLFAFSLQKRTFYKLSNCITTFAYLKTNFIKLSFCWELILGDGKPSCANRECNHLAKLSQYFLFNTRIMSLRTSTAERGLAPPETID